MSSKEPTVLELPEEIHDIWRKAHAYESCKEVAIKSVFAASLAIKFAVKQRELEQKAWMLIRDLYKNEYDNGVLTYFRDCKELRYEPRK